MNITRILRHLIMPPWWSRRIFSAAALQRIEATIRKTESTHAGQVRFAVETALHLAPLLRQQSARQRAIDVFSQLRIWDTEHNNGVLVYLLLADRDVEIVADRGIHTQVGGDGWERICREMEAAFRAGRFESGVIAGIEAIGAHLARHYPGQKVPTNELPDTPVLL